MKLMPTAIRRVFESSDILPKIMATNNDKSLHLLTPGTADDELQYHTDNDSEQEKNSDCEIIDETVSIQLHGALPTNSLEEKQPKQSEEMAAKQLYMRIRKKRWKERQWMMVKLKQKQQETKNVIWKERIGFKLRRKT